MPSGVDVVKERFFWLLAWQSIQSTVIFLIFFLSVIASFASTSYFSLFFRSLVSFVVFHSSLLILSFVIFLSTSALPYRPATPIELVLILPRYLFSNDGTISNELLHRAKLSFHLTVLVVVSGISGSLLLLSLCGKFYWRNASDVVVGLRGLTHGLIYGVYYIFARRWVLEYPIIQRPVFFGFKMGLPRVLGKALKLSSFSYVVSGVLVLSLSQHLKGQNPFGELIANEIVVFIGGYVAIICWELNVLLHQVLYTKRFKFAPPKGSAAAETNPSEDLLVALKEAPPGSILQNLAYLDLCMVCSGNVDIWRRAAFFEETGQTYRRVISSCLKHLENFTSKICEGLENFSVDKQHQLSYQSRSQIRSESKWSSFEFPCDFQLCVWCAQAIAALTAHSHGEDRYGVAQLSGSNAKAMSVLLSCLLALEELMGRKANLRSPNQQMGPTGIKWAAFDTGRTAMACNGRGRIKLAHSYPKAYAMADVLRNSIYRIITAFGDNLLNANPGLIEKEWLVDNRPVYGTREMLSHKLQLFVKFQAC